MDPETLKQKYQALTPLTKQVLFGKKTLEDLWFICQSRELDEKQISLICNELVMVIIGINPKSTLADQIERLGIEKGISKSITNEIEGKILKKIDELEIETPKQEPPKEDIKSYDSFEQTILRQAQAMRPASIPRDNPDYSVTKPTQPTPQVSGVNPPQINQSSNIIKESQVPSNLPDVQSDQTTKPTSPPSPKYYAGGNDPYREPAE